MNTIQIEYQDNLTDYTLLDSGNGEKLETFGMYTIARPDPRILWQKGKDTTFWEKADARFVRTGDTTGTWQIRNDPPSPWKFKFQELTFLLRPTDFKHVGIFPEQAANWKFIKNQIKKPNMRILNLFGYTGAATVVAAKEGAFVTHVDSVKSTLTWANENCRINTIGKDSVRWIEDDAYKFVLREGRRGSVYDAIIMDPPRFGRGPKGEVWKIENDLPKLLAACKHILTPHPVFFLLNAYTADISSLVLHHLLGDILKNGTISYGELATKEKDRDILLPQGIVSRWQAI